MVTTADIHNHLVHVTIDLLVRVEDQRAEEIVHGGRQCRSARPWNQYDLSGGHNRQLGGGGGGGGRITSTSDLETTMLIMSLIGVLVMVLAGAGASITVRVAGLIGM